jgi:hypothetical protein
MTEITPAQRICAKRADDLSPGVPYVRGWSVAKRGADALAEQLRFAGAESEFPGLKADVNVFGDGLVCLGVVRPDAANLLASLITTGLAMEMAQQGATGRVQEDPDASAA